MKIILLQDVAKFGKKFEVKNASDGYALNFLLPQRLARLATKQAIKELEAERKKEEETKNAEIAELKNKLGKLKKPIEIKAKANKEGKLFASLDKKEIAQAIQEKTGLNINPKILELEKPIKIAGEHKVKIKIGEEETELSLNIKAEEK
ncbi:MAG: 50S ribosomal protein L9 [Patescibacteria group bacterium]